MQPSTRGLVVLTAAVVLGSCSSDPTDNLRGEAKVVATPSTVTVNQGATEFVTVELVDELGSSLAADFTVQNVGPGITVVKDSTFLPTAGGPLQTSARFVVAGTAPAASSFQIVAGGAAPDTVPVNVVPTGTGIPVVTVASTGPSATDPTVLTVPAPFQFAPDSAITFDAGAGIVIARSEDGRSVTILPPPGTTSTGTVSLVTDYLPTVAVPTTTDVPLTISATVTPMAGTGSPATAPAITIPAPGSGGGFFDGGSFDYVAPTQFGDATARLYQFTVTEPTTLTTTLDWPSVEDMGLYFFQPDGTTELVDFVADVGFAGEHPETITNTFEPGTYLVAVVNWDGTTMPFFSLGLATAAAE